MTKKEIYIAEDGKEFATEAECRKHEESMKKEDIKTRLHFRDLNADDLTILYALEPFNPETRFWGFSPNCKEDMDAMRKYIDDETEMPEDTERSDPYLPYHFYIAVLDWDASDTYYFADFSKFVKSINTQIERLRVILN